MRAENKLPKSHLPSKLADTYTEFNQGEGVDLFVLADSNEQMFEFLNIADLATRFNICFPVPSKRPDDVLSVLEMVWISWVGPHESPDVGHGRRVNSKESSVSLWKLMASEAPWQNGLVERNGEPGKRLQEKQSKMSEHEVSWKCEDSPPWRVGRKTLALTRLDIRQPNGSPVEETIAMVTSG